MEKTQNSLQHPEMGVKSVIGGKVSETRNPKSNGNAVFCKVEPSKSSKALQFD